MSSDSNTWKFLLIWDRKDLWLLRLFYFQMQIEYPQPPDLRYYSESMLVWDDAESSFTSSSAACEFLFNLSCWLTPSLKWGLAHSSCCGSPQVRDLSRQLLKGLLLSLKQGRWLQLASWDPTVLKLYCCFQLGEKNSLFSRSVRNTALQASELQYLCPKSHKVSS